MVESSINLNPNLKITCDDKVINDFLIKYFLNNDNEELEFDPNYMIKSLDISNFHSKQRGWDRLCDSWECTLTNCPLSSFMILICGNKFLERMFKKYKLENLKGEYLLYYSTYDGKDAHGVDRVTLKDFYLSHVYYINPPFINREDRKNDANKLEFYNYIIELMKLNKDFKCSFFEIQYKSHLYGFHREDKYTEGYVGNLTECTGEEMAKKKDEILKSYDKFEEDEDEKPKKKIKGIERFKKERLKKNK